MGKQWWWWWLACGLVNVHRIGNQCVQFGVGMVVGPNWKDNVVSRGLSKSTCRATVVVFADVLKGQVADFCLADSHSLS